MDKFIYSNTNKRYHTLDYFYKQKFGEKVCKISLNAGFTCPNIDGTLSKNGCIYCSKSGSGEFGGNPKEDLIKQFNERTKCQNKFCTLLPHGKLFLLHRNLRLLHRPISDSLLP